MFCQVWQQWSRWIFVLGENNFLQHFDGIVHVLIILVWWTGVISSFSVSPGIVPYPLERDDRSIGLVSNLSGISNSLLVKFSPRYPPPPPTHPLFPRGLIISHRSPCSAFLFHYLVGKFNWCKQFIMVRTHGLTPTHVPVRLHILTRHKMVFRYGNQYLDFTDTYLHCTT